MIMYTMNLFVALYAGILFYLLTPNILLRLPQKGSKQMVAFVHAVVFALVLFLTTKFVWMLSSSVVSMFTPKPQENKEGLENKVTNQNKDKNHKQGFKSMEGLGQQCQSHNDCKIGRAHV